MTDYLTNLAARALGVSEVARPRPSLFEPRRGVEPHSAAVEPDGPDTRPGPEAVAQRSLQPPPRRKPAEPPPSRRVRRESTASEWDRGPPPAAPTPPAPSRVRGRSRPAVPDPPPPATARKTTGPSAPAPLERPVSEKDAPVVTESRRRATPVPPLLRPARLPQRVLPARQPPEPSVRVTIGRIDVRAVKPDEPSKPRRKPKAAQRMSLDEYLARSKR
jgi:hypothetical protein